MEYCFTCSAFTDFSRIICNALWIHPGGKACDEASWGNSSQLSVHCRQEVHDGEFAQLYRCLIILISNQPNGHYKQTLVPHSNIKERCDLSPHASKSLRAEQFNISTVKWMRSLNYLCCIFASRLLLRNNSPTQWIGYCPHVNSVYKNELDWHSRCLSFCSLNFWENNHSHLCIKDQICNYNTSNLSRYILLYIIG